MIAVSGIQNQKLAIGAERTGKLDMGSFGAVIWRPGGRPGTGPSPDCRNRRPSPNLRTISPCAGKSRRPLRSIKGWRGLRRAASRSFAAASSRALFFGSACWRFCSAARLSSSCFSEVALAASSRARRCSSLRRPAVTASNSFLRFCSSRARCGMRRVWQSYPGILAFGPLPWRG